MKYVKTFESFRYQKVSKINEEFIIGMLKGALGKVMSAFGQTFKDMANDFKNAFKEDDPSSIKGIIMQNFNQAVDAAEKALNNKEVDEAIVKGLMDKMVQDLVALAAGIDKDVIAAVGKDKSKGPKDVAKAIILGNKKAGWSGIVGLLDPLKGQSGIKTNYKYSKTNYEKAIDEAKDIKLKKSTAIKFLDEMQKDIQTQLDKEFSEEEIQKVYSDANAGGSDIGEMNYDKLKVFYDKKTPVIYLLKGKKRENYDPNKKPEEQTEVVGVKPINTLNDQNKPDSVVFLNQSNQPIIKKSYADIIGPTDEESDEAKSAKEKLGKIKDDKEKMKIIGDVADALSDPKKAEEIKKLL